MRTERLVRPLDTIVCLGLWVLLLALPAAGDYPVGVVSSDDAALQHPVPRDQNLTADQILGMVRRAVSLVGGMGAVVPDTAGLVLIKPNIGSASEARTGINTDDRVVRAVAILVHEAAPNARILIAEGAGGWMSPSLRDCTDVEMYGDHVEDGFDMAGHRATVRELRQRGIDIACYDLNFDRAYSLHPVNGGLATDEYSIAAAILDADVWINVPVAKTHGAKITCCMKNHFGILPGRLYGWSKAGGTRHHVGMPHSPRLMDEAWIDLYGLTRVDFNVVDMIAGSEAGAFEENKRKRSNIVLAGANPIATDLVVARLMGFNPDDFEFAELAWQNDLGPRSIDEVSVRGGEVGPLISRWKKAGVQYGGWGEWAEHSNYGMGPRYWTLLGPVAADHAFSASQIAALEPAPGQGGWSEVVYFGNDKIDLDKHFDDPVSCAAYAFTRFTMARSDSVRFWMGSDEGLTVWLDGQLLHDHRGRRRHTLGAVKQRGYLEAGEHRLLVRAEQGRGGFEFSYNVCEPIDDELYAGNRYPGVRYYVEQRATSQIAAQRVDADDAGGEHSGSTREANLITLAAPDPLELSRTAPDTILVDAPPPERGDLVGLLAQLAGLEGSDLDELTLKVLGAAPFTMGHEGFGREGRFPDYGPELSRVLDWLGLRYAITYGYGQRESLKTIHGWLAAGHVPVTGNLQPRRGRRWRGSRQAEWGAITGYRQTGDLIEVRMARPGNTFWIEVKADWRGVMPGGMRENCPVIVAQVDGQRLRGQALVDSISSLALELGLRPELDDEPQSWGTPTAPGGIAGWDWWVVDWERLPLTPEWAREEEMLDRLERLGSRYPPELADSRELASRYFAAAAERIDDGQRRQLLHRAADGYGQVAAAMRQLAEAMPETDARDRLTPEDEERLDRIGQMRTVIRRARTGEREALGALSQVLGRGPLPAILEDPLKRKPNGVRLFTWRAITEDSVYGLELVRDDLRVELLEGDEADEMTWEVHASMPHEAGWEAAVEPSLTGGGRYRILHQPTAANGWRVVVIADDGHVRMDDNAPELVVWALPPGN